MERNETDSQKAQIETSEHLLKKQILTEDKRESAKNSKKKHVTKNYTQQEVVVSHDCTYPEQTGNIEEERNTAYV